MMASRNCRCSTWSSASTATRSRPTKRPVPWTTSTPRSSVPTPSRRSPDDFAHPALAGGQVDADLTDEARSCRHTTAGPLEVVGERDQRLRRDAPDVQAGAAELLRLDEHDVAAELARPCRRRVAAGPPAEDEDVDGTGDLTGDHQSPSNRRPRGASRWRRMASPKLMMSRPSTTRWSAARFITRIRRATIRSVGVELRTAPGGAEPGDADFGAVDERRAEPTAEDAMVGDGERAAGQLGGGEAALFGRLAEAGKLGGDVEQRASRRRRGPPAARARRRCRRQLRGGGEDAARSPRQRRRCSS